MAVDGGVDTVLHEHVLIAILYVGRKHFVLPRFTTPRTKATMALKCPQALITTLRSCISDENLMKLRYLMVDGVPVNHVARKELDSKLKRIYLQIL